MRLFELSLQYRDLQERAEEGEDVSSALEALGGALEVKAEAIGYVLRDMQLDADKLDAEIKRLTERKKTLEANVTRTREYLRTGMLASGIRKIKGPTFSLSLVDCPERVEIEDESLLPDAYVRIKREPSKSAILAAYKADGECVPGTRIERGTRLVIR